MSSEITSIKNNVLLWLNAPAVPVSKAWSPGGSAEGSVPGKTSL